MNARSRRFARSLSGLLSFAVVLSLLLSSFTPALAADTLPSAEASQPTGTQSAPAQDPLPVPSDPSVPPDYSPTYEPLPEPAAAVLPAAPPVPPQDPDAAAVEAAAAAEASKTGVVAGSASALLDANGGQVALGNLQVRLIAEAGAFAQATLVTAEVLPTEEAQQWSPVGMAFRLHLAATDAAAAPVTPSKPLTLTLDYSQIPMLFGGSFAGRLTLYRVGSCPQPDAALQATDPELAAAQADAACRQWEALPGISDPARQLLTVTLTPTVQVGVAPSPAETLTSEESALLEGLSNRVYLPSVVGGSGAPAVSPPEDGLLVLAAATSSQYGDYSATPFANVKDYQVSLNTGAFQTSYPLPIAPAPAGATPELALRYDSGSVDGMNINKNSQAGWVGIGWSLESGAITRHLKKCDTYQDLCLAGDTYSIVLNGISSRLVQVSGALYRLQSDPYWKVEKLTSANTNHPDKHKEYWQVTTPDGAKYRFGGEFDVESGADQNSAWVVPIYDSGTTVCGTDTNHMCDKAYQWSLDRSEETNGNVTKYFYEIETNYYGSRGSGLVSNRKLYTRGGYLTRIEYGHRTGVNATPPARVQCAVEERCEGACVWPTNYPDTPGDLVCAAGGTCDDHAPSFWSRKRLNYVEPQYYNTTTSSWVSVARYDLEYAFPTPPNDPQGNPSEKKLWLSSITQKLGDGTGGLPPATYGYVWLDNRADAGNNTVSPLKMARINVVTTQLGGTVHLTYFQSHPCEIAKTTINHRRRDDCAVSFYYNGGGGWGYYNRWKVQQMTVADAFSGNASQTTSYLYTAPIWHYADDPSLPSGIHLWNDFRGSAIVTETLASGVKVEHRFHRGKNADRADVAGATYYTDTVLSDGATRPDENWLAGREVETRVFSSSGVLRSRTVNWFTWTLNAGSGRTGAYFVAPQKQEQTLSDPGAPAVTTRVEYLYDSYGNPTREVHHGDTSTTADDRTVQRVFLANTTAWIVDKLSWEKLWAGAAPGTAGQEKAFAFYVYDNGASYTTPPTLGNLTRVRRYAQMPPTAAWIETTTTYDSYGRPTVQSDGRSQSTTTAYHAFHGYVTSVTNPLSHVVQTVNDPGWGVPLQITDANGGVTTLQYDGYGRLSKVWLPTEPTNGVASLEFVYSPSTRPAWVKTRTLQVRATASYLESWQYVDGFGRELQTQTPLADGNRAVTHQSYDALGRLQYQSAAYQLSGAAGSSFSVPVWSTAPHYTQTTYDDLDRPVKAETRSQSTLLWDTETSYQGLGRTDSDERNSITRQRSDAFGRLVSVTEEIGATPGTAVPYTTTYAYDLQGNLTQVTDAQSHVTTMGYDLLGRKLSMTDPDMGSWSYQYDANGNLIAQRDGRGQWLHLSYDPLNRLSVKRRDTAGTGPKVAEYLYDAAGQKGLLSKSLAYDSGGAAVTVEVRAVTYDARNRLTRREWVVAGGGTFRMDYAHNEADARTSLTYPGDNVGGQGEVVSYAYNTIGRLTSVAGSGVSYLSSALYNAQGQPTQQVNDTGANGLTRLFSYESNTLRLFSLKAGANSPAFDSLQSLSYYYDNAADVIKLVDAANAGQKQCFGYDTLRRLTSAYTTTTANPCTVYNGVGVGPYSHSYAYDAVGNLTSYAGQPYTYGATQPHAVTQAHGNSYGYDANGNQTSRTIAGVTYTFVYDSENRLTQVKQGESVLAAFVYDADGERVLGSVGGVTTVYVGGVYEYVVGTGATTHYYEGNALRRTGHAGDNGVFYLLQDHLHSSSALAAQNGTLSGARNYYYPFGGSRGGAFNALTAKRFTGQYHEQSIPGGEGLSYYGARWYDARLGRFVTPDSIVPQPDNPQDFNRYTYVRNNPLRYTDPTGHVSMPMRDGGGSKPKSRANMTFSTRPPAPQQQPNPRPVARYFSSPAEYILAEMRYNPTSPEGQRIARSNKLSLQYWRQFEETGAPEAFGLAVLTKTMAYAGWAGMVCTGCPWDHKGMVSNAFSSESVWNGVTYRYDTWSNYHYGYVARAVGFGGGDETVLLAGAGGAQLLARANEGWANLRNYLLSDVEKTAFFDEKDDALAIQAGFNLWSQSGGHPTLALLTNVLEATFGPNTKPSP